MLKDLTLVMSIYFLPFTSYGQDYIIDGDTLKVNIAEVNSVISNSYFNIVGINISNFYQVIDSLSIHINNDKKLDKILILSPITQVDKDTLSFLTGREKRLLVGLISSKRKRYTIGFINENAILNSYDYMSDPFRRLKMKKDRLTLFFEFGSIINYQYSFVFIKKRGDFILNKREIRGFNKSNPAIEKRMTTSFKTKNYSLRNWKINDFIIELDL